MTITLITPNEYQRLLGMQQSFPVLTYQQKDYDNIDRSKLTSMEKRADDAINAILQKSIKGFSKFQNFNIDKNGDVKLRFQYSWTADEENSSTSFTGVGYIYADELVNGFRKEGIKL